MSVVSLKTISRFDAHTYRRTPAAVDNMNPILKDTAAGLFKEHFRVERGGKGPRLGVTECDALEKHVVDLGLWVSVLDAESERMTNLGKNARRHPLGWLISNYKSLERTYREINTPPDRLTTHRTDEIKVGQQRSPQELRDLLASHGF